MGSSLPLASGHAQRHPCLPLYLVLPVCLVAAPITFCFLRLFLLRGFPCRRGPFPRSSLFSVLTRIEVLLYAVSRVWGELRAARRLAVRSTGSPPLFSHWCPTASGRWPCCVCAARGVVSSAGSRERERITASPIKKMTLAENVFLEKNTSKKKNCDNV